MGSGTVMMCATSGCNGSPTMLASSQAGANGIAVDTDYVYWVNYSRVMRCSVGDCGTPPTTLALTGSAQRIAVDATSLYWINFGLDASTVMKLQK